jgi:hypothetical protein
MDTPHLSFEISFPTLDFFLHHWASRYHDPERRDDRLYDPHIGKADLRTDHNALKDLFTWKNGGDLSKRKLATIRDNYFDHWTEDADLESRYLDPDKGDGPIWNIFYLHCRQPKRYPIYDQHAYRAMLYIQTNAICEDLTEKSRRFVYDSYRQEYQPFVADIRRDGRDLRTVDRALYAFGRFLKLAKPYVPNSASRVPCDR